MNKLLEKLGYSFKNINLLKTALTHSSYANENNCKSYERMEFLGDSVLGVIVSNYLFHKMKGVNEGELSRIRASLVCEESLAELSKKIGLGEYIFLGKGEERAKSRERASILSDVYEATLSAIYLDGGMIEAEKFVLKTMNEKLKNAVSNKAIKDYKSRLQEEIQKITHGKTKIEYIVVSEKGPEHNKQFRVKLLIDAKIETYGMGYSKKEAEQNAAKIALEEKKYEML